MSVEFKQYFIFFAEKFIQITAPIIDVKNVISDPFPGSLFQLINHSTNKQFTDEPSKPIEFDHFASVCNFSNVATLLYVILVTKRTYSARNMLTVHVVGAYTEIALFTKSECWLLFYWLPKLLQINLYFIGPELPDNTNAETLLFATNQPDETKQFNLSYHRECYETFVASNTVAKPDVILCYNAGFEEMENSDHFNNWRPAISSMLDNRLIPIAFTSYIKNEARMDMKVLENVAEIKSIKLERILEAEKNPYRDLRPCRNWEDDEFDEIFYYNGYINLVIVK